MRALPWHAWELTIRDTVRGISQATPAVDTKCCNKLEQDQDGAIISTPNINHVEGKDKNNDDKNNNNNNDNNDTNNDKNNNDDDNNDNDNNDENKENNNDKNNNDDNDKNNDNNNDKNKKK